MGKRAITTNYRSDPPPSVIAQRPPLTPDPRSAFGQTNENLKAQKALGSAHRSGPDRGQMTLLPTRMVSANIVNIQPRHRCQSRQSRHTPPPHIWHCDSIGLFAR
jgi:hypothetical protein